MISVAVSIGSLLIAALICFQSPLVGSAIRTSSARSFVAPRLAPQMTGRIGRMSAPQRQNRICAEEGGQQSTGAEELFAESKTDDDSLFAILREPLRPPSEWVPVDVSGSDWLGSATDDDLLSETPTESQEDMLAEYMRHENDKGSPEYQIAKTTQRVYHLTKHLATNRKDYSTTRGLVIAIQQRRKNLVDLYKRNPTKFRDVVMRLGIRARLPPKPTLIAMDKKALVAHIRRERAKMIRRGALGDE